MNRALDLGVLNESTGARRTFPSFVIDAGSRHEPPCGVESQLIQPRKKFDRSTRLAWSVVDRPRASATLYGVASCT